MNSNGQGVWTRYEKIMRQAFGLTDREAEVARECIKGLRNKEIAAKLSISLETVNKHLDAVYRKAKVRSRVDLMAALLIRT